MYRAPLCSPLYRKYTVSHVLLINCCCTTWIRIESSVTFKTCINPDMWSCYTDIAFIFERNSWMWYQIRFGDCPWCPKNFQCYKSCRLLEFSCLCFTKKTSNHFCASDVATRDFSSARKTSKDRIYKVITFHGPSKNESTLCALLQRVGNSIGFTQCNSLKSNQVRI